MIIGKSAANLQADKQKVWQGLQIFWTVLTQRLLLLVLKITLNTVWEVKWAAYYNRTRCGRVAARQTKSLLESGNIIDDDAHPTSSSFRLKITLSLSLSLSEKCSVKQYQMDS